MEVESWCLGAIWARYAGVSGGGDGVLRWWEGTTTLFWWLLPGWADAVLPTVPFMHQR
jgi:hypothetical protein